jgi:hypothetical protein
LRDQINKSRAHRAERLGSRRLADLEIAIGLEETEQHCQWVVYFDAVPQEDRLSGAGHVDPVIRR